MTTAQTPALPPYAARDPKAHGVNLDTLNRLKRGARVVVSNAFLDWLEAYDKHTLSAWANKLQTSLVHGTAFCDKHTAWLEPADRPFPAHAEDIRALVAEWHAQDVRFLATLHTNLRALDLRDPGPRNATFSAIGSTVSHMTALEEVLALFPPV